MLAIISPLPLASVAITSFLAPPLKTVGSSTTSRLSFGLAVQTLFLLHILHAVWLIPISHLSLGGFCKRTKSTLCLTPISNTAMVQSYDLAQLCWIKVIIADQRSRLTLSFGVCCGSGRSHNFGHCDKSSRPPLPTSRRPHPLSPPQLAVLPSHLEPMATLFKPVTVAIARPALVDSCAAHPNFLLCHTASVASDFIKHRLLNAI